MKRNIAVIGVVIILLAVALYQNFAEADDVVLPKEQAPKTGFLAPSFTAEGMDGNTYQVGGSRDKVLLLNVWASWCGPCKLEAPDLTSIAAKYADQLDVYALNATNDDDRDEAIAFAEQYGYIFPVLWDDDVHSIVQLYRVVGYPTSFIIDKNGVIQEVIQGIRSRDELERLIRKAM